MEKTGVLTRRHKSDKPSTEGIIHTNVFNRSKRNQVSSRIETRDNTAGVSTPEHLRERVQNDVLGSREMCG